MWMQRLKCSTTIGEGAAICYLWICMILKIIWIGDENADFVTCHNGHSFVEQALLKLRPAKFRIPKLGLSGIKIFRSEFQLLFYSCPSPQWMWSKIPRLNPYKRISYRQIVTIPTPIRHNCGTSLWKYLYLFLLKSIDLVVCVSFQQSMQ